MLSVEAENRKFTEMQGESDEVVWSGCIWKIVNTYFLFIGRFQCFASVFFNMLGKRTFEDYWYTSFFIDWMS